MDKKKIIIGMTAISMVVLLVWFYLAKAPREIRNNYYTPEPEPWITQDFLTPEDDYYISVKRATREKSNYLDNKQEYYTTQGLVTFFTHGFYRGEYFDHIYASSEFYSIVDDKSAKSFIKMQIGNNMDPGDGIINGLVVAKENNKLYDIYIFVDEDWREQVPITKIVYGDDFTNRATLKTKNFDFSRSKDGIYINIIKGITWKNFDPVMGGMLVGEVDLFTPQIHPENLTSTFIYVR